MEMATPFAKSLPCAPKWLGQKSRRWKNLVARVIRPGWSRLPKKPKRNWGGSRGSRGSSRSSRQPGPGTANTPKDILIDVCAIWNDLTGAKPEAEVNAPPEERWGKRKEPQRYKAQYQAD